MKHKLFLLALLALTVASCTKNEIIEQQQPAAARTVRVSATLPQTAETRTTFYDGTWNNTAGYGFKVKWAVGDKISILCWQGEDAANWGNLISDKDSNGKVTTDKGEIIHTLTAADISADGRTINFSFTIPTQITDNSQPIKALLTYTGGGYYTVASGTNLYAGKPWLDVNGNGNFNAIRSEADRVGLLYAARSMPMTLRGEIAAGWSTGAVQPLFSGKFKHEATLFAVQVKNNTEAEIDPEIIQVKFWDRLVMNYGYSWWNPIAPQEPTVSNQYTQLNIYHSKKIAAGESFVYFVSAFIVTPPTKIHVGYVNRGGSGLHTSIKANTTLTLQAGKCYTLNVQVNSITDTSGGVENTDFAWNTGAKEQAPWE